MQHLAFPGKECTDSSPQQEDIVPGEIVYILRSLQHHQLGQDGHRFKVY